MTQSVASQPVMSAAKASIPQPSSGDEQRFLIHGVSFKDYSRLRDALDMPGLRMTYCEGVLELMSPSMDHQYKKKTVARLIEVYALERGVRLYSYGNATLRKEARERGASQTSAGRSARRSSTFPTWRWRSS